MYRFNGQDRRLERLLEAVTLVLESLPSSDDCNDSARSTLQLCITGHSGDSPEIPFVDFGEPLPANEAERFRILQEVCYLRIVLSAHFLGWV